jgi:hypothetical protein
MASHVDGVKESTVYTLWDRSDHNMQETFRE